MELAQETEIDIPAIEPQNWNSFENYTSTQYFNNY